MVVPVKFADVGKSANDLLGKDFPVGQVKLEVKTFASNGVNFTVNGNKDNKTGTIFGELKTKYTDKAAGLTVTESWSSNNVLGGEVELEDSLAKGLKLNVAGSLLPAVGQKNAKVGVEYKQDYVFTNASLDLFKGPTLCSDISVGFEGFLVGGEVAYDIHDGKINRYNAALGYSVPEYSIAVHALNGFSTFTASYFHRVSPQIEAGGKAVWDKKAISSAVGIEVGTKYNLDRDSYLKTKVNNAGMLGLSFTQALRPGVKVSLGGSFDTTRLNENAHKLGLSLTLEA